MQLHRSNPLQSNRKERVGILICLLFSALLTGSTLTLAQDVTYPIVDTNENHCFSETAVITCGQQINGQDAQYAGLQPHYQDNGDGTITDLNTGLMWQQDPGSKQSYAQATAGVDSFNLAGYTDWRVPTIKELYSLILFSGVDASKAESADTVGIVPFIDTDYFHFSWGDTSQGDRVIDSQWVTSTVYQSKVMDGQQCFFGVNFADGHVKCYPIQQNPRQNGYFAIYVRGNPDYGVNKFLENGDGTISDKSTGLVWMQADSGDAMMWADAVNYCENLTLAGVDDWRLPNIKELHSIVDYTRAPDVTGSAAIDPIFQTTAITNELDQSDYGHYWSSTTFVSYPNGVTNATYIAFGRALGYMEEFGGWVDVHGAGAQRADPKPGVEAGHQLGAGPQGDARRSANMVRCVRGGVAQPSVGEDPSTLELTSGASSPQGQPPVTPAQSTGGQNQGGGGEPPQMAIDACSGLSNGATCSFQTPNGTVNGTCHPAGNTAACLPNN